MKKKINIALITILQMGCYCNSQNSMIIDSISKKPIPFVNVQAGDEGLYSNNDGIANLSSLKKFHTISLTHIGYYDKQIKLNKVEDSILMSPRPIEIKEIVVSGQSKELLFQPLKKAGNFGSWVLSPKNELLTIIRPKQTENRILRSVSFPFANSNEKLRHNNHVEAAMVRINIYKVENNVPFTQIYSSIPIETNSIEKDLITLEFDENMIELTSDGLCFGIEMLGYYDELGNSIDGNSYVRPILTNKVFDEFYTSTLLRNVFGDNNIFKPITSVLTEMSSQNISERNLSIGLVLY